MGADYACDLSQATIVRILRVSFEQSDELEGILPAYIMRMTREVKKWEHQFQRMHENTSSLRFAFEQVLNESL